MAATRFGGYPVLAMPGTATAATRPALPATATTPIGMAAMRLGG